MNALLAPLRFRNGPFWCSILVIACLVQVLSINAQFDCVGGSVYTVAHPDDDLLFQSPTLLDELQSGLCITTVFFTSGDAGDGLSYAESREAGSAAAYAQMLGIDNSFTDSQTTFGGQPVMIRTLNSAPQVQKIFLRLPDGNEDGSGFAATGFQSLQKLFFGQIDSISSIDGAATFTLSTLSSAISQILAARAPDNIRTQDYLRAYDGSDHSDHLTIARITQGVAGTMPLTGYMAYPVQDLPPTLSTTSAEYQGKAAAFFAYTPFDFLECQSISGCSARPEDSWLQREYDVFGNPT